MASTPTLIDRSELYLGGSWSAPAGDGVIEVVNASTEEVMGRVPEGAPADVDAAVGAARAAFEGWSQVPAEQRAELCAAISLRLQERQEEVALLIAGELGMPIALSTTIQAGLPIMDFGSQPQLAQEVVWEERIGNSLVVREPVGVVGAITPWNYPLHQIAAKVAPAMTAGCTVVLKPSEVAPLNAFVLAEVIDEVGVPAGVFNLVCGHGPVVGEAIAAHAGVDMVSFTGSTRAGRRVSELAAATVKRVALELGGKSPNVILDDADLEQAVVDGIRKCYLNSGQTCSALTRMLVPRDRLAVVDEIARQVAESYPVGDPLAEGSALGPLVSDVQRERVRGYIRKGIEEGARLVAGGEDPPEGLERGLLRAADRLQRRHPRDDDRPGGDLRAGAGDPALRRRGGRDPDRQCHRLRAGGRRLVGRPRAGQGGRPPAAHRPGRDQRRRLQPARAVRRLQAVRPRARARPPRPRGVPGRQVAAALERGPPVAASWLLVVQRSPRPHAGGTSAVTGQWQRTLSVAVLRVPST